MLRQVDVTRRSYLTMIMATPQTEAFTLAVAQDNQSHSPPATVSGLPGDSFAIH